MKKLLVLLLAAFLPQTYTADEAKTLLNNVSILYKTYTDIQADFLLTIEVPDEDPKDVTGRLYLKGEKFRIEMDSMHIICDGDTIWNHLVDLKEVQINTYEPEEEDFTPDQLFTLYNEKFLYRIKEKTTISNVSYTIMELSPVDKKQPYFKIDMTVNPATNYISAFKVYEKNGVRSTYKITAFNCTGKLAGSLFSFNPKDFPGVTVDDLR